MQTIFSFPGNTNGKGKEHVSLENLEELRKPFKDDSPNPGLPSVIIIT